MTDWKPVTREEIYAYELHRARAQIEHLIHHLSHIGLLCQGENIKLPDGRVMKFHPPDAFVRECWEALSKAIREIPTVIAQTEHVVPDKRHDRALPDA